MEGKSTQNYRRLDAKKVLGLILGPVVFAIIVAMPPLKDPITGDVVNNVAPWVANASLGLLVWVVIWWLTSVVPFGLTALVAAVVASIIVNMAPKAFGFSSGKIAIYSILETFAHPIIWVFFGGFVLGYGMTVSGLAERLSRKIVGFFGASGDFFRVVMGMWTVVWIMSMWMSNTAATAVMYPLLLAVLVSTPNLNPRQKEWAMIGLAYAASLGGIATIIGTPPNLVATAFLSKEGIAEIGFVEWLRWGLPISAVLFLILLAFGRLVFGSAHVDVSVLREHWKKPLGPMSGREKLFVTVFTVTVTLWVLRGVAKIFGWTIVLKLIPHDAIPAILAAVLLFGTPSSLKPYKPYFDWRDGLAKMDWNTLFLFAGGLVVGDILFKSKAGLWIGRSVISLLGGASPHAVALAAVGVTWLITQFASNTATANMMSPILIALSQAAGFSPVVTTNIVVAAAISASLAFLLPVSTPPNAIVFGSGMVRLENMVKYGAIFSVVSLPLTMLLLSVTVGLPLL